MYYPEEFDSFRNLIVETWPGMDIERPEPATDGRLSMFCYEDRILRELYWTGSGFQIWCQLLSHVFRYEDHSMLVIDEPDIYLHANLQRRLLSILKSFGTDVLIATHSSELLAEADANDILVVDKNERSAKRVRSATGVQTALDSLGSAQLVLMTAIAQWRRVLYVEGEDFKILRRFARVLGLNRLADGVGIAPFTLGGFPSKQRVNAVSLGVTEAVGTELLFAGVFDRDYRPDEEIEQLVHSLGEELVFAEILDRKEIENYLLVPTVLDKALERLRRDRSRRTGESTTSATPIRELLQEITSPLRTEIQAQYVAKRSDFFAHSRKDSSTASREAIEIFDRKWNDDELRLHIVPGKKVLGMLISRLQREYRVNLTKARIIEQFRQSDIPRDLRATLMSVDSLRDRPL